VVEGPGQISRRTHSNGKVQVNGQEVGTVTAEGHQSVPCAVVRIFALHAGPVAVGSSAEGASPVSAAPVPAVMNSPSAVATAGTGSSLVKLLEHLLELGLCVAAAGLVMVKSRAVPAVQPAGTSTAAVPVTGSDNIALAGLAIAGLGLLWLLGKLIVGDLFPALFLMLSGLYLSSDGLRSHRILPPNLAEAIKPLAMPIAGATALFGLLHLFLADWYFF
jgi:hypothetical protein